MTLCFITLIVGSLLFIPLACARCVGSNCSSSLSTGAKIAIGVSIAVVAILLIAGAVLRQCLLRRRLRQQQQAGFSIAPLVPGATAASTIDGAGAAGIVGDGRYPQPGYSNNAMSGENNNMTQAYPNGFASSRVGQGAGRVPAPPPSYSSGVGGKVDGSNGYEGNMAGVGGFRPPPGPPPNFDANQRV